MKQQQQGKKEVVEKTEVSEDGTTDETKTFEGGFFQVNSPVKPGTIHFFLLIS